MSNGKKLLITGAVVIGFIITNILTTPKAPSKIEAIEAFKNNLTSFTMIQQYAENTEGYLQISRSNHITMENEFVSYNIHDEAIKKEIWFILKKLHFDKITEGQDDIWFLTKSGPVRHGIIYLKHGYWPPYELDQKIAENWYYFEMIMPG